jgi:ribosomal protein L11 methyltransferase
MRELVLTCPQSQAVALSDALLEAGALAVSVEDAAVDTEHEQALFGEPGTEPEVQAWEFNRVSVLMPDGLDPAQLMAPVLDAGVGSGIVRDWVIREVPDADWVRLTQSQFGPIMVSDRIWIVPSWHRDDAELPDPAGDEPIRIELDPGLAFGTGSHPTTHLCLEWLAANLEPGQSVLDYGCGSGILAIAACLLGAGTVRAVDIDEQAVESTRQNARVNHVQLQAFLPDALPGGGSQVVVANILSNPLKVLAPMLAARVAPCGALVLSGVLERQAVEVARAYAPWIALHVWQAREGWVCLAGRRQ